MDNQRVEKDIIINGFKITFIDFKKQYEEMPYFVINTYVRWLFDRWNLGLINLTEYRELLNTDLGDYV